MALLALLLAGAATGLGLWQLEAWRAARAAEARDLTELAPVPLAEVMGPDDTYPGDQVGRPVEVTGRWLAEGTFHVSGREQDGSEGYWVVTPLQVRDTDAAIPVVRGWAEEIPVAEPSGPASVEGWLQPPEGRTDVTDDDLDDDVVPQLRVADAIQRVDVDLWSAYVVVDADRSPVGTGLAPADLTQLPEADRTTALRNLLYALEWWVFAAFALYVGWRHVRDQLAEGGPPGRDGVAG